jgi:hypothetical protein
VVVLSEGGGRQRRFGDNRGEDDRDGPAVGAAELAHGERLRTVRGLDELGWACFVKQVPQLLIVGYQAR